MLNLEKEDQLWWMWLLLKAHYLERNRSETNRGNLPAIMIPMAYLGLSGLLFQLLQLFALEDLYLEIGYGAEIEEDHNRLK